MKINWRRLARLASSLLKALLIVALFTVALCFLFDINFHWKLPIMNTVIYMMANIFLD